MKLFGKAKKAPPPSESIARLRDTLGTLEKREDYLQAKCNMETEKARANARTNRRVALMALKRKRTYESQMNKISQARFTIETQIMYIENAATNLEAMQAMELGAQTLQDTQRRMTVNDVDNIMDNIREQMDVQDEISEAISQPLGMETFDDDELEEELRELESLQISEQLNAMPTTEGLPATSSEVAAPAEPASASAAKDDESAELAKLEAAMAAF
mmetsp:Transcript_12044/g.33940  ORF Transcript_12044/g.33940 Transcript_12044/m.33940 type:complete len:217 (+) Transcript_12044:201-851(+)